MVNWSFPLLLPISPFAVIWQFLILSYLIADFTLTVMAFCFPDQLLRQTLFDYFDPIMVVLLALDILVTLNTCAIQKGQIIDEHRGVALHYVRSIYFWSDVGSLIVSILEVIFNDRSNFNPAFNFIVFIKIIKGFQLDKHLKRYGIKHFYALLFYQIGKNIIFLALMNHVVGCFAFYIDYWALTNNKYGGNPDDYWILSSYSLENILGQDLWVRYTYSFYFSTSLISGVAYGDLVPQNPISTGYVFFILFFPMVVYAYIFNAIYSVIAKQREKGKKIKKKMFLLKNYLSNLRVREQLQIKLITYMTYFLKNSMYGNQFINKLAPSVKKAYTARNIHAKFNFQIFEQMLAISPVTDRIVFREELMDIIQEESFPERYKMILPHRIKLYYLNQGLCKRVTQTTIKYSDDIKATEFVGFYNFLTGLTTPKLKYESASYVTAFSVERKTFLNLLKDSRFFQLRQAVCLLKQEKIMYNNSTVNGQCCFFCNSASHYLDRCPSLRPKLKQFKQEMSNHFRKKQRRLYKNIKKVIGGGFEIKDENQKAAVGEVGVQCEVEEFIQQKDKPFELVTHMRVYYPQSNLQQ